MDFQIKIGTFACFFFLFVFFSIFVPRLWKLSLALVSSVFQVHTFPILGVYPPLALISCLSLWPDIIRHVRIFFWEPLRWFLILFFVHLISLFWSPDLRLGVRNLIYLLPFLFIFFSSYALLQRKPTAFHKILTICFLFTLVEAVLVVIFRVSPLFEESFLKSSFARVFISPNVLEPLFGIARNNVLDPAKAGGFFVNANVAAGFLGMSAFLAWGIGSAYASKLLKAVSCILLLSVFFTGSKAGSALGIFFLVVAFLGLKGIRFRLTLRNLIIGLILFIASFGGVLLGGHFFASSDFVLRSGETLGIRFLIWGHAWDSFWGSPLFGHGFGGWEQTFGSYAEEIGINKSFPPHNTLIYLWSQSGVLALLMGVSFMLSVIVFGVRMICIGDSKGQFLALGTTIAFLWVFVQGMGTNWGVVGEVHMQPILAASLALTYSHYVEKRKGQRELYG